MDALLHELTTRDDPGSEPPLGFDAGAPPNAVAPPREHRFADEPALVELVRLEHGGVVPMVEAAFQGAPGSGGGGDEALCFLFGARQRLLAEHVLASFERGDANLGVRIGVGQHQHRFDAGVAHRGAPIGAGRGPDGVGQAFGFGFVAIDDQR